ncbi:hypothetical protein ACFWHV_32360 [Streptomyces collinus]|uniref:hypothetical protein n=1 Tax=Streptomyces collinus TaxID=42684 RepID=UPI00364C8A06
MDTPKTPTETMWVRLDEFVRAEEAEQRAERAHWARTREAFPPAPTPDSEQPQQS